MTYTEPKRTRIEVKVSDGKVALIIPGEGRLLLGVDTAEDLINRLTDVANKLKTDTRYNHKQWQRELPPDDYLDVD